MTDLAGARARVGRTSPSRDQGGLPPVEYAIIFVLISALGMAAWQQFGSRPEGAIGEETGQAPR